MEKNKYQDDMTINHVQVLKPEEMCAQKLIEDKFFGCRLCKNLLEVVRAFKAICERYNFDENLLHECKTDDAFDESLKFDLRVELGSAFQEIKRIKEKSVNDAALEIVCMKYIISICVLIPEIVYKHDRDSFFKYAIENHII